MRVYSCILNNEIIDMDASSVSNIISRGGTILFTARCEEFKQPEYQDKAVEICKSHGIDGL
ncbi:MAG: 6-phosphofructokinase, partial [Bacteroides sp.]|nr:6-phosphofructokinase [Bacteroides sp.]